MKRMSSKKGFTIVELVIVIAVIAILAGILVPTFTSVIRNANASAAMQDCQTSYMNALAEVLASHNGTLQGLTEEVDKEINSYTFYFDADGLCGIKVKEGAKYAKNYQFSYTTGGTITCEYKADLDATDRENSIEVSDNSGDT